MKRHRAHQLSSFAQLHAAVQRQGGGSTAEQEEAIRELTEEMHHLAAADTPQGTGRSRGGRRGPDQTGADACGSGRRVRPSRAHPARLHQRLDTLCGAMLCSCTRSFPTPHPAYTASSPLPALVLFGQRSVVLLSCSAVALADDTTARVWCEKCNSYQLLRSAEALAELPAGAAGGGQHEGGARRDKVWKQRSERRRVRPTRSARATCTGCRSTCTSTLDAQSGRAGQPSEPLDCSATEAWRRWAVESGRVYELTCVISHISDPPDKDSPLYTNHGEHLVAHCKISRQYEKDSASSRRRRTARRRARRGGRVGAGSYSMSSPFDRPSSGYEASCFTLPVQAAVRRLSTHILQPPSTESAAMAPVVNPFSGWRGALLVRSVPVHALQPAPSNVYAAAGERAAVSVHASGDRLRVRLRAARAAVLFHSAPAAASCPPHPRSRLGHSRHPFLAPVLRAAD